MGAPDLPAEDSGRACSVEGCGRSHRSRGYCSTHYTHWRRVALLEAGRVCSAEGCDRAPDALGLCHMHYLRRTRVRRTRGREWSRTHAECTGCGSTERKHIGRGLCARCYRPPDTTIGRPACSVQSCERPEYSKRLCRAHYVRWRREVRRPSRPARTSPVSQTPPRGCSIDGCDKRHEGLGLCGMHYQRKLNGTLDRPRPRAKLNEDKVRAIRREYASADRYLSVVQLAERLAERYGVSVSTISRVLARATWARTPNDD